MTCCATARSHGQGALSGSRSSQRALIAEFIAVRAADQGRVLPRFADSAVSNASALVLPSFHASGIASAIKSDTANATGGGAILAVVVNTPAGTGSCQIERFCWLSQTVPRATA